MKMKLSYLIFFLVSTLSVFSQEKMSFNLDFSKVYEPVLKQEIIAGNNISLDNKLQPVFSYSFDLKKGVSFGEYKYTNVVVEEIEIDEITYIDVLTLQTAFNPSAIIVKNRDQDVVTLNSNVLYKDSNGNIYKVISFDFEYNLKTSSISNSRTSSINTTNLETSSVLSTGVWYKIAIDKTGVFKMDTSFLNSIGINTSSLNPKQIRVYGNGGALLPELLSEPRKEDLVENAIFVSGENDNVFNEEDYVLFYGQGPMGWELNSRTDISHIQNIYDEFAYYFINVDSGIEGKRIENSAQVNETTTKNITTFTDYQVHEKELINYIRAGRKWFGEDFQENNSQTFEFDFPNIDVTTEVSLKANFSAASSNGTTYTVLYNNSQVAFSSLGVVGFLTGFTEAENKEDFIAENSNIELQIIWNNNGDLSGQGHLDYLQVVADRFLVANGSSYSFLNFDSTLNSEVLEYSISESSEADMVWDITDFTNVKSLTDIDNTVNTFTFKEITDGVLNRYYLVDNESTNIPIKLSGSSNVPNQNLHGLSNVQYLIITTESLKSQAEILADYHRQNSTISNTNNTLLNVEVVELDKIYNEFGSGSSDITAIRDFVKHVYDNSPADETGLKYLCLFGDASFDYKGIIYPNTSIVPSYEATVSDDLFNSYVTDDYYAYLDVSDDLTDNNSVNPGGQLDISTGRVPVKTLEEAKQFVDKALNYYSTNSFGAWKNKISLLGDDGQEGSDQELIEFLDESAIKTESDNPSLNLQKLYTDAFKEEITAGGGAYPNIVDKLNDAFNYGALVINYFGHGNVSTLGEENYLNISSIKSYRNLNNLPLFITVTCDFSRFDDPLVVSGGEELMIGAFGGTASMISTGREISITTGRNINTTLADYLYNSDGGSRTIAESLKDTKNDGISNDNELFVFFLGDPAMRLSLPEENIILDNVTKYIKDNTTGDVSFEEVTELNGLSRLRVTGSVTKNSSLDTGFNGILSVVLYGEEIERETLLNEAGGVTIDNIGSVYEFSSLENVVFRGEASVKEGKFEFDFILPKDVNILPGEAKFSFYVASEEEEGIGSNFDYEVGGIDVNAVDDDTPPVIQLFFENESFVDGGTTSTSPNLLAKIYDESGINTSLSTIGHNISLVIDGDNINSESLNDFYTTEVDDFTNGIVNYELPELEVGEHTISFKAWDTHNNSSTQTLTFYVEEDKGLKISEVLNYPNPFINYTEFWFNHNRRGDSLDIKVQIYTVSGKLLKTIRSLVNDDLGVIRQGNAPAWDGKDDYGNRLGKGVYLYKLVVKDLVTGEVDEKIEKIVIL